MDIRIGFSDGFFGALTKLPANIQAKVNQMVLKFNANPKSTGLNYEKLNPPCEKYMRSLRVDQTYRVILAAPDVGNVYLLLWVDHHDEAYEWASSHKCKVNENTGAIQLYATQTENVKEVKPQEPESEPLFTDLKDRHLLKLGVPEEQINLVRGICDDASLDEVQELLPLDAYEALFFYKEGQSYEDILRERDIDETATFDTDNFAEALERIQSQSRFVVVDDDAALSEMLNAPIEKWRVFLHPSQRKLASDVKNGAVRVLGGAGTGKTVVAMHRAKWLAKHVATEESKVLFTTFTKNLAIDIQRNLASICSTEELARIEVINLDQWVQRYLRKQSYDFEVVFNQRELDKLWGQAMEAKPAEIDFSDAFFKEEWQRVIQPQGVTTLEGYKKASRKGRGTRLNRLQRIHIWQVFEEYRHLLTKARVKEVDDAYRDCAALIDGEDQSLPYSAIVVDEAQDMGSQAFNLLRKIVPEQANDIFIVGDAHQRIYGRNKVVLSKCGINIRGRSRKLKINYRTTDEIRAQAIALLTGRSIDDLDGGSDDNNLYKSLVHGEPPLIEKLDTAEDQANFICALLEQSELSKSHTCIVARTHAELGKIKGLIESRGVATIEIKQHEAESANEDAVKLATIHRVKGLEFDQVVLASANEGLMPLDIAIDTKADAISQEEADTEERSLVYVALTRARKAAYVLSYGVPSRLFG